MNKNKLGQTHTDADIPLANIRGKQIIENIIHNSPINKS